MTDAILSKRRLKGSFRNQIEMRSETQKKQLTHFDYLRENTNANIYFLRNLPKSGILSCK